VVRDRKIGLKYAIVARSVVTARINEHSWLKRFSLEIDPQRLKHCHHEDEHCVFG